nr:hypothetical protein CFP56_03736 [Quercus suber]
MHPCTCRPLSSGKSLPLVPWHVASASRRGAGRSRVRGQLATTKVTATTTTTAADALLIHSLIHHLHPIQHRGHVTAEHQSHHIAAHTPTEFQLHRQAGHTPSHATPWVGSWSREWRPQAKMINGCWRRSRGVFPIHRSGTLAGSSSPQTTSAA